MAPNDLLHIICAATTRTTDRIHNGVKMSWVKSAVVLDRVPEDNEPIVIQSFIYQYIKIKRLFRHIEMCMMT